MWTNLRFSLSALPEIKIDGRFHSGISEESLRIIKLLLKKLNTVRQTHEIIVSGHSLGGAIAAISKFYFDHENYKSRVITFGAPRYCDRMAYERHIGTERITSAHIIRDGDMIPSIPNTKYYASPPAQFAPDRTSMKTPLKGIRSAISFGNFMLKRMKNHSMEKYRTDLEIGSDFSLGDCLINLDEIK